MADRPKGAVLLKHRQEWRLDINGVKVTLYSDQAYRIKHNSPSYQRQAWENESTDHLCGPLYPVKLDPVVTAQVEQGKGDTIYEVVLDSHPGQADGGWYESHVLDLELMPLPTTQGQADTVQWQEIQPQLLAAAVLAQLNMWDFKPEDKDIKPPEPGGRDELKWLSKAEHADASEPCPNWGKSGHVFTSVQDLDEAWYSCLCGARRFKS
jgi:hypothetical protein